MNKPSKSNARIGTLTAERDALTVEVERLTGDMREASDAIHAVLMAEPTPNGKFVHLLICSGDRNFPAGIPGHSCCCNIVPRGLLRQVQKERDDLVADNARLAAENEVFRAADYEALRGERDSGIRDAAAVAATFCVDGHETAAAPIKAQHLTAMAIKLTILALLQRKDGDQ